MTLTFIKALLSVTRLFFFFGEQQKRNIIIHNSHNILKIFEVGWLKSRLTEAEGLLVIRKWKENYELMIYKLLLKVLYNYRRL